MGQNKKYFWLKLKENFFEEKQIKYLRSLPDGDKIVIAYLKMQLKSLKTEGFIKYDSILPSNIDELAMVLDENTNIIKLMIGALQKVNAVEILDDGSFYMIAMQDLIGKEGESAERVRRFRERQEQKLLQCNGDVTNCNTEIEKDIDKDKEKEKEIEIEKNIKKEKNKKRKTFEEVLAENNCSEELEITVRDFIDMRKTIKKPMTSKALELLLKNLTTGCKKISQLEVKKLNGNNNIINNNINKNIKKEKNKKRKTFEEVLAENNCSEELESSIRDFIDMRKTIKKPMTSKALELLIKNLEKLTNLEEEKIAILNQSIERGWQTVYPLKINNMRNSSKGEIKEEEKQEELKEIDISGLTTEEYDLLVKKKITIQDLIKKGRINV